MSRTASRHACNRANRALDQSRPALGRGLERLLESSTSTAEGPFDSQRGLRQLLGVGAKELLRTDEIAREFRFPSAEAARKFISRHDVPREYRGRILLVDRRDFLKVMAEIRKSRLRGVA